MSPNSPVFHMKIASLHKVNLSFCVLFVLLLIAVFSTYIKGDPNAETVQIPDNPVFEWLKHLYLLNAIQNIDY